MGMPSEYLNIVNEDVFQTVLIRIFEVMGNSPSSGSVKAGGPTESTSASSGECPVKPEYRNPAVYNVYGQKINDPVSTPSNPILALQNNQILDSRNNMPLEPNQLPCPGQRKPLSTDRIASIIPKGGTDTTWLFPSPQMVFNGKYLPNQGINLSHITLTTFVILVCFILAFSLTCLSLYPNCFQPCEEKGRGMM
jgi:hypothetical protein